MRRLLKFLHTMGAIGLMGAMVSLAVMMIYAPPPTDLAGYASVHGVMAAIGKWILFPSLALTICAGMLSIAANPAFHNAGWAWAKLATGVLIFEGGLMRVQGPIQEEAERSASALAGQLDPATLTGSYGGEETSVWVLLAVATANVVLGVRRPRFSRIAD